MYSVIPVPLLEREESIKDNDFSNLSTWIPVGVYPFWIPAGVYPALDLGQE
jgi:hypothetical protein